jgi:hypothetical protein
VAKVDMRYFEPFQQNDVVAAKVAGYIGKQVELAKWCAGRQEDDYREFYFDGELLMGRRVFMRLPVEAELSKAVWTTAYVNDLPDSHFLLVLPGGKKDAEGKTVPRSLRKLPYKSKEGKVDLPHVRNAIARIPQMKDVSEEEKKRLQGKARRILAQHTKKFVEPDEMWVLARFSDDEQFAAEALSKKVVDASTEFVILKKDTEKRIVLGPVLVPEQTDLQGDIISSEAIEKAAHNYLAGLNATKKQGVMHRDFTKKLEVVECYIAPVDFEIEGRKIMKGTWMLAFRILDDETWEDVKKGVLRGFSIGGVATDSQKIGEGS